MSAHGLRVPLSVCASEDALPEEDALPADSGLEEEAVLAGGLLCSFPEGADDDAAEDAGGFGVCWTADAFPCPPGCAGVGCGAAVGFGVAVGCGVAVGFGVAVGCGVTVGFGVAVGCGAGTE